MFSTMDSDVQLTTSAGTPAFMAPECLNCKCMYLPVNTVCVLVMCRVKNSSQLIF